MRKHNLNKKKKKADFFPIIFIIVGIMVLFSCLAEPFSQGSEHFLDWLKVVGIFFGALLLVFIIGTINGNVNQKKHNYLEVQSRSYQVRCLVSKLKEDLNLITINKDTLEELEQEIKTPIFCELAISSHGLCISRSLIAKEENIGADKGVQFDLFHRDQSNPLIIAIGYHLYCLIQQHKTGVSMYTEELAELSSDDQLEIVILFRYYLEKSNLKIMESLKQPVKLNIIAVDSTGQCDISATYELYKILYERSHPRPSDEDDSWMYHSRPIYW
jgi:hypothetical protein